MLERARRGDMKAHEVLYRGYGSPVYTLAMRMLSDAAQAEEVLQDTSIEVIRHIGSFRDDEAFGGWVKRIATNKCLMHLRSAWHRKARNLFDGEEPEAPDWMPVDHDDAAVRLADQDSLTRALETLSPTARAVVWLYDVEGYSHQEIAAQMGKTVSFSKSALARAHERLRACLGPEYEETDRCTPQPNSC
jgi:RNA polymerase sigma factor (sigma-70 family)